jgi:hypothetical protein
LPWFSDQGIPGLAASLHDDRLIREDPLATGRLENTNCQLL